MNWEGIGVNLTKISSLAVQGRVSTGPTADYETLIPLIDQEQPELLTATMTAINDNANPEDSAEVIDQAAYDVLKVQLLAVREELAAQASA